MFILVSSSGGLVQFLVGETTEIRSPATCRLIFVSVLHIMSLVGLPINLDRDFVSLFLPLDFFF